VLRERWPSKGRIDPHLHCRLVACWTVGGLYRTVGGVFGRGLRELARGNFLARSRAVGGFAGAGGQVFWLGALGGDRMVQRYILVPLGWGVVVGGPVPIYIYRYR
jgi:hypothetical protein